MIIEFSTKRDRNGNRYYLAIDTENKTFARNRSLWYSRGDTVEIGRRDRLKMIEQLKSEGFLEIDCI